MRALPGRELRTPPGPLPPTRDRAAQDQRRRILDATAQLVAERGYNDTTVELIVRKARVGYTTFYKHYENKEQCFLALIDSAMEQIERTLRSKLAGDKRSWPEQVATGVRTLFEEIVANPEVARAVIVESLTAGPAATTRFERALDRFAPLLRSGRSLNPDAELPDNLENALASAIVWMAYQRLVGGEVDRLMTTVPDAVELILSPYLGEEAAGLVQELTAG